MDIESFDEVRLLSNYPNDFNKLYRHWLGQRVTIVPLELERDSKSGPSTHRFPVQFLAFWEPRYVI